MIQLNIVCEDKKIATSYEDNEIKLVEVAMVIMELEKIKLELLNLEFDKEFELNDNGDDE